MTIQPAKIHFSDDGIPIASDFEDPYFTNSGGLQETQYVFIRNNQLSDRWLHWQQSEFVIAETGFGTGLNFLAAWQTFTHFLDNNPNHTLQRLHFISTEKFPLTAKDLQQSLAKWPELASLAKQLLQQYPYLSEGCHRLVFEQGKVILDLWLGDIHDSLPQWHNTEQGLVDAWFLDGFAPSKNPHMWNDALFAQLARLSKQHATFATFTAAGIVKRGLTEAGFTVEKRTGFGQKRHMLAGSHASCSSSRQCERMYYRYPKADAISPPRSKVAIVGAGMAAANLALSLTQKGFSVEVFCAASHVADGASGNPQGGFYPQLNGQANIASHLQLLAFDFARRRYKSLLMQGLSFSHQWCGVLQIAFNENVKLRQQSLIDKQIWPSSLIHAVDEQQSSQIANIDLPYSGLFMPDAGWICPPELVQSLFCAAQQQGQCEIHYNMPVLRLAQNGPQQWVIHCEDQAFTATHVVLAVGAESPSLSSMSRLPWQPVRGQVEAIPTQSPLSELRTVLCHKGYLTPSFNGQHALGSTYQKRDSSTEYRIGEQQNNLHTLVKSLSKANWVENILANGNGRAAIRSSLPDHLPAAGAIFDWHKQTQQFANLYKALPSHCYPVAQSIEGLYVLGGLGSRGLTTAPLMAEIVASQISRSPLPLATNLLNALNPNRFLIKQLIRREVDL